MSAAAAAPGCRLQSMLQTAVQRVQWTYSLFWQFCPQQGVLVWVDGYYNGAIKTRKTVQPMEVSAEEASLQRSQQLRELYDMLSAGESNQPQRRPSAALSPEDLTETEWFYLMCVSFSFPPGMGLPGKAYAKRQHVWLTGANEVDSKVFSRAILAKSARIQTVVCIPLLEGVVELGTTNKIQEDMGLIQKVKSCFTGSPTGSQNPSPKPALSEQSTSNPTSSSGPPRFSTPPLHSVKPIPTDPTRAGLDPKPEDDEADDDENENENDDDDDEDDDEEGADSDSEAQTVRTSGAGRQQQSHPLIPPPPPIAPQGMEIEEPSELMQLEMSEDIRLGSPDDCSNNLDSGFHLLAVTHPDNPELQQHRAVEVPYPAGSGRRWPATLIQQGPLSGDALFHQLPAPGGAEVVQHPLEELTQEDTHYSQTVSTILHLQTTWWSASDSPAAPIHSPQTVFSKWTTPKSDNLVPASVIIEETSQWLLKYILFSVPFHHTKAKFRDAAPNATAGAEDFSPPYSRFRKMGGAATPQEELSANHVLAERRRREKLNERFMILRSLVPFVSKMDKASILGDTIEYVKQLRRKIQDLEEHTRPNGSDQPQRSGVTALDRGRTSSGSDRRKLRVMEGTGGKPRGVESPPPPPETMAVTETVVGNSIEVSIIETDALLELQCSYREGLLLDVMQLLRDIRIETTTVQSSLNNGAMVAELRAKVKDNVNGKKTSIVEVKRAINQIIPHES